MFGKVLVDVLSFSSEEVSDGSIIVGEVDAIAYTLDVGYAIYSYSSSIQTTSAQLCCDPVLVAQDLDILGIIVQPPSSR